MEDSSLLLFKGCTSWQRLLLTASILTWHLSTITCVIIESVPSHVTEGEDVIFLVHNLPENIVAFAWFKGLTNINQGIGIYAPHINESVAGPVYSGRETIYHNGSLLLKRVTKKEAGFYTLRTYTNGAKVVSKTFVYLHVHGFLWNCGNLVSMPTIESVPPRVAEGGSIFLLVHNLPENTEGFVWFKGIPVSKNIVVARYVLERKSTVWGPANNGREKLYKDASLLLQNVTQKDPGLYTLQILRGDMRSAEAHVQLQVHTSHCLCCNPLNSSQLMIHPVPPFAAEGDGVLLQVHNLPEDIQVFSWYKSMYREQDLKIVEYSKAMNYTSWGPAHRRQGMVYNNGSLMLQNITEKDAGMYILEIINKEFKLEKAYVEFYVKKSVMQPFVRISDTTVRGHRSVIFTCISPDTDISIHWIFNNQSLQLTERVTLSPTNCALKIDPVRSEDIGEYKCEVSNRFIVKTSLPVWWPR